MGSGAERGWVISFAPLERGGSFDFQRHVGGGSFCFKTGIGTYLKVLFLKIARLDWPHI